VICLPLNLAFKGARNYLQGPDLLAGLMRVLGENGIHVDGELDVAFYQKTGMQPDLALLEADESSAKTPATIGHWSVTSGERRMRGWYVKSDRLVEVRMPYDEDSIVGQCTMDGNQIAFHGQTAMTAAELCVAMAKAMHIARFPISADKHWVVCRFALGRPLDESDKEDMRVELGTTLGARLTKSALYGGGKPLGHIYFSPAQR